MLKRKTKKTNIIFFVICGYLIILKLRHVMEKKDIKYESLFPAHESMFSTGALIEPVIEEPVDPVTLVHNYKKIEKRFEARKQHLRIQCETSRQTLQLSLIKTNILADENLPVVLSDTDQSFFGCISPESGSTIFHAWWWDIYHPDKEFNQHARRKNIKTVADIPIDILTNLAIGEQSLKFLVVRHPLTRFVSSWDDHFCYGCYTGTEIIAKNNDMKGFISPGLEDYQIGFKELVEYATKMGTGFDDSFNSQNKECDACAIKYDYILKLETIYEDIQYLMAKLNRHDNTKELISQETITKNKNSGFYKNYFNTLSKSELEELVYLYQEDLELFNYSFDFKSKNIGGWD